MRRNPGRWRVSPSKSQRHARAYKQLLACQWLTGARDVASLGFDLVYLFDG